MCTYEPVLLLLFAMSYDTVPVRYQLKKRQIKKCSYSFLLPTKMITRKHMHALDGAAQMEPEWKTPGCTVLLHLPLLSLQPLYTNTTTSASLPLPAVLLEPLQ